MSLRLLATPHRKNRPTISASAASEVEAANRTPAVAGAVASSASGMRRSGGTPAEGYGCGHRLLRRGGGAILACGTFGCKYKIRICQWHVPHRLAGAPGVAWPVVQGIAHRPSTRAWTSW